MSFKRIETIEQATNEISTVVKELARGGKRIRHVIASAHLGEFLENLIATDEFQAAMEETTFANTTRRACREITGGMTISRGKGGKTFTLKAKRIIKKVNNQVTARGNSDSPKVQDDSKGAIHNANLAAGAAPEFLAALEVWCLEASPDLLVAAETMIKARLAQMETSKRAPTKRAPKAEAA